MSVSLTRQDSDGHCMIEIENTSITLFSGKTYIRDLVKHFSRDIWLKTQTQMKFNSGARNISSHSISS